MIRFILPCCGSKCSAYRISSWPPIDLGREKNTIDSPQTRLSSIPNELPAPTL